MRLAVDFGNAGVGPNLNVGRLLDLVDQILRHGARQRVSAHQHDDALRILGKVHRRLAGGIRAAHHVDDFALAGERFGRAAAVVDARALQAVDSRRFQPPPLHSGRNHQRVAGNLVAIGQFDDPVGPFDRGHRRASCGDRISTPKRWACTTARRARSPPLSPAGNPR